MNLRLRLIVVFFLLSVVPVGAVTYYAYSSNAQAIRDAAGWEAELLLAELSQRMGVVTAQLSQRVERLMVLSADSGPATPVPAGAVPTAPLPSAAVPTAGEALSEHEQMTAVLGPFAGLLDNIEVRPLQRFGRGGRRAPPTEGPGGAGRGGPPPGGGAPPVRPLTSAAGTPVIGAGPGGGLDQVRRRGGEPGQSGDFDDGESARISIDLNEVRRELFEELVPDREAFGGLPVEERQRIFSQIDQRMLGVDQGIRMLQQELSSHAAEAVQSAGTLRSTELSGSRLAVRLERDGELVGQVDADVDLPKLLATVLATAPRDRGEVPFAVGQDGRLYTQTEADHGQIEALHTTAVAPGSQPGTTVLADWIVGTTPDLTGSGLKFGIARPVGDAIRELRQTAVRNAAFGLGFIALALIGIVPLAAGLTRNLDGLSAGVNRIARGDYAARVTVRSNDEVGRLARAFNQMAADVEVHQRSAVEQERIRGELELGRQIQHDMLPQAPLRLGLTEVKGVSVPAREVGGDFFNYFPLVDGTVALLVGDVSGKGVGAALLMANLQAALRARLSLGQALASLAQELDLDIERSTPGPVYATLFVGIFDPITRHLRCVNAGHNPQYVLRGGGALERLESTGRPIGLLAGGGYVEQHVDLTIGDVLFCYTDGCVEAENAAGDMFGPERLEQLLSESAGRDADAVLRAVETRVTGFRSGVEPRDDATMMVVKVG